jgi:hypothetical protein
VAGPIEFTAAEAAVILAILGLAPPLLIALVGFLVHVVVLSRRPEPVKPLVLFLKWWGWCTLGWIGAWIVAMAGS